MKGLRVRLVVYIYFHQCILMTLSRKIIVRKPTSQTTKNMIYQVACGSRSPMRPGRVPGRRRSAGRWPLRRALAGLPRPAVATLSYFTATVSTLAAYVPFTEV